MDMATTAAPHPEYSKPCKCTSVQDVCEVPQLNVLLPDGYSYRLCNFDPIDDERFHARFRINVTTKEEAIKWMDDFSMLSKMTFLTRGTFPSSYGYKVRLRCYRNTRPSTHKTRTPHARHTACEATMTLTVKKTVKSRKYKSRDLHLPSHPTVVILRNVHNHPITSSDSLKFRVPSTTVQGIFVKLFQEGHTPTTALYIYNKELQKQLPADDYLTIAADRAMCPNEKWVYHLYDKVMKKKDRDLSESNSAVSLDSRIEIYNRDNKDGCAKLYCLEKNDFVIVLISPLMKRVLETIPQAVEVMFCVSAGDIDLGGCKVFLLLTNSSCGGLPMGAILASSETEFVLTSGLAFWLSLLPVNAFNGTGTVGPSVIFTEDSAIERKSFSRAFPKAHILFSGLHILQDTWKYVWNPKNSIPSHHRGKVYSFVKNLMYSETEVELAEVFENCMNSGLAAHYPEFSEYVECIFDRKVEWALYLQQNFTLTGLSAKYVCEASIKVLKDRVLQRINDFSVIQLFDFLTSDLENHYIRRINDFCSSALTKTRVEEESVEQMTVVRLQSSLVEVKMVKSNCNYYVEPDIGFCSCQIGKSGTLCKHQIFYQETLEPVSDVSKDLRQLRLLYFVATGSENISIEYIEVSPELVGCAGTEMDYVALVLDNTPTNVEPTTCETDTQIVPLDSVDSLGTEILALQETQQGNGVRCQELAKGLEKFVVEIVSQSDIEVVSAGETFLNYPEIQADNETMAAFHSFKKDLGENPA